MIKLRYTRINHYMRQTEYQGKTYIIGKDSGTIGNTYYYYIEFDGKVIQHGHRTLRDAKRNLLKLITGE